MAYGLTVESDNQLQESLMRKSQIYLIAHTPKHKISASQLALINSSSISNKRPAERPVIDLSVRAQRPSESSCRCSCRQGTGRCFPLRGVLSFNFRLAFRALTQFVLFTAMILFPSVGWNLDLAGAHFLSLGWAKSIGRCSPSAKRRLRNWRATQKQNQQQLQNTDSKNVLY